MDFQKLVELFPNLKRVHSEPRHSFTFHIQGQLYAIPEEDLTYDHKQLIQAFADHELIHTNEEKNWLDFLNGLSSEPPIQGQNIRLTIMQIQNNSEQQDTLKESISLLLNKSVLFLWEKPNLLVLLESLSGDHEPIPFEKIIDVMSDDLDLNLRLMISNPLKVDEKTPEFYKWFIDTADKVFTKTSKRLVKQGDALILLLPEKYTFGEREYFGQSILQNSSDDEDLIKTIKTVIEHQGNVTAAAKTLYMHRNSVQYRLDKFQELTGHDIKNFNDMLNVYLAIQLIE